MQTFLLVVGILFVAFVLLAMLAAAALKKVGVKAGVFLMRKGIEAIAEQARADYSTPALRDRCTALIGQLDALPAPSLFNAKTIVAGLKPIAEELASISTELDRLKAATDAAKAEAIVIDGTATVVEQPLALPAPADTNATTDTESREK